MSGPLSMVAMCTNKIKQQAEELGEVQRKLEIAEAARKSAEDQVALLRSLMENKSK